MATNTSDWVKDWQEDFACEYPMKVVESWVGKQVEITRGDETFHFNVIGCARILITSEDAHAEQLAIVTDEAKQIALRTGDKVQVISDN
jgi:uncharacterized Zn ribbon protein